MIPRYGEPPRPGRSYRLRHGVYAVLRQGVDILLTHQSSPIPEFQLPGGGVDPGETVVAALHREVFEETGWRIAGLLRLGAYRRFTYMPEYDLWAEKMCHIYAARPVMRLGPPSEPGHTAIWTTVPTARAILASEGDVAFLSGVD